MPKEIVSTDDAPKGLAGYSQAVKANGLIFVSGQVLSIRRRETSSARRSRNRRASVSRNVEAILKAAGSSIDSVVQATFILDDESDFPGMNEEWGRWFLDQPPARQGAQLPIRPKGMRISIAAIATTS